MLRFRTFILLLLCTPNPSQAFDTQTPDTCKTNQLIRTYSDNIYSEFIKKPAWHAISYIDCSRYISSAYMHLYKNDALGGPDPESAQHYLQLSALIYKESDHQKMMELIKSIDPKADKFITIYKQSITWSEKQKQKSGDDLYTLSKNLPAEIQESKFKDQYRDEFLLLSAEKGYSKARIEIEKSLK